MKLNPEHKELYKDNLPFGVHKVELIDFTEGQHNDKTYIEVTFKTPTASDNTRLWFGTDKGAQRSFNILSGIFVHNAPEAKKAEARELIQKVGTTADLATIMNKVAGKEAWVSKAYDPNRTYQKDGQTFRSINTDIYGYEPPAVPENLMPGNTNPITEGDVTQAFPGATPAEGSVEAAIDSWGDK